MKTVIVYVSYILTCCYRRYSTLLYKTIQTEVNVIFILINGIKLSFKITFLWLGLCTSVECSFFKNHETESPGEVRRYFMRYIYCSNNRIVELLKKMFLLII